MAENTHLQGTVGPLDESGVAAGQSQAVRTGKAGGFLNTPVSASFQEAVLRGRRKPRLCDDANLIGDGEASTTQHRLLE